MSAFNPITNFDVLNKPRGGLWASPVDAERSWHDWVKDNEFYPKTLRVSFEFELSENARVLELTPDNVWELPLQKNLPKFMDERDRKSAYGMVMGVDFEALAQDYDVLECSLSDNPSLYWSLYGWDCDCILVLNPEVIVECTK
jgi:hypothetical protein